MPKTQIETRTFFERGILIITLRYERYDPQTGAVSNRQVTLQTDLPILPELQWLYDDTLCTAPTIREHHGENRDARFVLLDNGRRVIGHICLDMDGISDRDLAWINCVLAEAEGSILALVPEQTANNDNHELRKVHISKRKRRRSRP